MAFKNNAVRQINEFKEIVRSIENETLLIACGLLKGFNYDSTLFDCNYKDLTPTITLNKGKLSVISVDIYLGDEIVGYYNSCDNKVNWCYGLDL